MNKSKKIALCGIVSALSLILLALTGLFPFAEYALPAMAGALLAIPVIEFDRKTAIIAFLAVGVLSLFIAPIKESAFLFCLLFGYYPIIKSLLEAMKSKLAEWGIKILLFNVAALLSYFLLIQVMGMNELLEDFSFGVKYSILILLGLGNIVFVLYDFALSQVIAFYIKTVRPKLKFIK